MLSSIAFLIGWPAIVLSLVLTSVAVVRQRSAPLGLAAILILPISLYLSATPRFPVYPLLLPLLLGAATLSVPRSFRVAVGLAAPVVGFTIHLATAALTYVRPE